ncbi:MAG: hypothetical protein PHO63_01560 [Bacilli bacterium]|nr:hypothetical protein [Bacilli bacterium]MDD4808557.1 hypothetical protein [Bacilli bacterium]
MEKLLVEQKYNELRKKLFDLRLKQTLQKPADKEEEYLRTEKEITSIKNELKKLIKQTKEEIYQGGRKK